MANIIKAIPFHTNRSSKMPLPSKKLAGPGFIILNIIRAMNIIVLLAVVTASVIMIVKTFTISKFYFFDGATHAITVLASLFLVVSECSIFKTWFMRNWPVLSYDHGFNFLGLSLIVLGINILGNLNKEATSQKSLGLAFWRIVISSGIVVLVMGFVNIATTYIFRDPQLGVTARQVRSKGAVAISDKEGLVENDGKPHSITTTSFPTLSRDPSGAYTPSQYSQASPVRKSPVRNFVHRARDSILPSYRSQVPPYPKSPERAPYLQSPVRNISNSITEPTAAAKQASKELREGDGSSSPRSPINDISAPLNVNPQFAHLVRPDIAHHPSQRRSWWIFQILFPNQSLSLTVSMEFGVSSIQNSQSLDFVGDDITVLFLHYREFIVDSNDSQSNSLKKWYHERSGLWLPPT